MKHWQKYIQKHQAYNKYTVPPNFNYGMVVVIPCYDEPDVLTTLNSLIQCAPTQHPVGVLVVVNSSEMSDDSVVQNNRKTYNELIAEINTTSAYPNPASSYVTIQFNFLRAEEKSILLVYDNLGRQVLSRNIGKIYDGQELIDTRKLTDGLYLYQWVQNGKKVSDGKFLVIH